MNAHSGLMPVQVGDHEVRISDVFCFVYDGKLKCRRCAGKLTVYVQSCRSEQKYRGCRRKEVSVQTGLVMTVEEAHEMRSV